MLDPGQLLWTQIGAGVCLAIFIALVGNALRLRAQINASKSWIAAEGEIIVSQVKWPATHTSDDQGDVDALIRYRYQVAGQVYEGDCVRIGGQTSTTRALAEPLAAKYPVGAKVDVHCDPRNPQRAALEPRRRDNLVAQVMIALVFAALAAILGAHAIAGKVLYAGHGVPLFAFALPILAFLIAIAAVIAFVRLRGQARASARWPTATGTIATSAIVTEMIEDRGDREKNIGRTTPRFRVDLRYAYRVGNRDFIGTAKSWSWTAIYGLRELAEQEISRYREGQSVIVHYDPAEPGAAVLEPNDRQGSSAPLALAGVSALVGLALLTFFVSVGFGP